VADINITSKPGSKIFLRDFKLCSAWGRSDLFARINALFLMFTLSFDTFFFSGMISIFFSLSFSNRPRKSSAPSGLPKSTMIRVASAFFIISACQY